MELRDTVAGMTSENRNERFLAEYQQLVIRMNKLALSLENEEFLNSITPIDVTLLKEQYGYMSQYEDILYQRADRLGIGLPTWDEILK